MKLYHITPAYHADSIRLNGLLTGLRKWEHDFPNTDSSGDAVYLSGGDIYVHLTSQRQHLTLADLIGAHTNNSTRLVLQIEADRLKPELFSPAEMWLIERMAAVKDYRLIERAQTYTGWQTRPDRALMFAARHMMKDAEIRRKYWQASLSMKPHQKPYFILPQVLGRSGSVDLFSMSECAYFGSIPRDAITGHAIMPETWQPPYVKPFAGLQWQLW